MRVVGFIVAMGCAACATVRHVPGYEGCAFSVASSEHGSCSSTEAAHRLKNDLLARRWIDKSPNDVKDNPSYSSLTPSVTSGADGTEIWRFTGGDNCILEETDGARMARSIYEAALLSAQSKAEACARSAALDSTIQCRPDDVGPPPPAVRVPVCRDLDWTTDFAIRNAKIVSVKYLRLEDDKMF
jgi:hypothetical protein